MPNINEPSIVDIALADQFLAGANEQLNTEITNMRCFLHHPHTNIEVELADMACAITTAADLSTDWRDHMLANYIIAIYQLALISEQLESGQHQ